MLSGRWPREARELLRPQASQRLVRPQAVRSVVLLPVAQHVMTCVTQGLHTVVPE